MDTELVKLALGVAAAAIGVAGFAVRFAYSALRRVRAVEESIRPAVDSEAPTRIAAPEDIRAYRPRRPSIDREVGQVDQSEEDRDTPPRPYRRS